MEMTAITTTVSAPRNRYACVLATVMLAGCMGDSSSDSDDRHTGTLTQMGIEGVTYETQSQTGTTDENGQYRYYPGERIRFSVGDLPLIEDVPVAPMLSPLEFTEEQRELLHSSGTDAQGFTSHRVVEEAIAEEDPFAINMTRFLLVIGEDSTADPDGTVTITQRTIEQINDYLSDNPDALEEIDFHQPVEEFTTEILEYDGDGNLDNGTPIDLLLDSICFEPEGDELCEEPPSEQDIDDAADEETQEELTQQRERILGARRSLNDINDFSASEFLTDQALAYKAEKEAPYYLDPEAVTLHPSDTGVQRIRLHRAGSDFDLADMDAETLSDNLAVHSFSAQTRTLEYFHDGDDGDSGSLIVNFKVDEADYDSYRWYRKTVRVCINEDSRPCST